MTSTDFSSLPPEPPLARFALPFLALSLGGLFLAGRHPLAPAGLSAVTAVLGLGYLPGLAVVLAVERRFGLWAGWVLPLMVSPLLVTAACLTLTAFGASLSMASSWVVVASVALVCLTPPPQRELEDRALTVNAPGFLQRRNDRGQVLLLAGLVLAVLAVMDLGRASALTQPGAVLQSALVKNTFFHIPPWDPMLAGLPYRGAWGWALYLGVLSDASRLDPMLLLALGGLVSAFTFVFACYRWLTTLGLDHPRAFWGTAFVLFALAPPIWHWLSPERAGGDAFFLGTFLAPGAHGLAWVYTMLVFWGVAAFFRDSLRGLWWAFLGLAGLWLFHPPTAALWSLVLLASVPACWIACGLRPWGRQGLSVLAVGVAGWIAALAVYPYLKTTAALGAVPVGSYLEFTRARYLHGVSALHWELVAGLVCLFILLGDSGLRRQLWAVWGVLAVALGFAAGFGPPGPEYALHLLLAPAVGAAVPWCWRKMPRLQKGVAAVLLVLMLPGTGLGLAAWFPKPEDAPNRELISWIEEETPPESVFIALDATDVLRARRRVYYQHDHVIHRGYNAGVVNDRRRIYFNVLGGVELDLKASQTLESLGRPLFWIDTEPVEAPPPWRLQTRVGHAAVYRWEP